MSIYAMYRFYTTFGDMTVARSKGMMQGRSWIAAVPSYRDRRPFLARSFWRIGWGLVARLATIRSELVRDLARAGDIEPDDWQWG